MSSFATCTFFDDCRTENNGKKTYIGGYGSELIANSLPVKLPVLWLQLNFATSIESPDLPKKIIISIPGETELLEGDLPFLELPQKTQNTDATAYRLSYDLPIFEVDLRKEGRIVVDVQTESNEKVRAGVLNICSRSDSASNGMKLPKVDMLELMEAFSKLQEIKLESTSRYKNITAKIFDEFLCKIPQLPKLNNEEIRLQIADDRILVFFAKHFKQTPNVEITSSDNNIKFSIVEVDKYGFSVDLQVFGPIQGQARNLLEYKVL